MHQLQGEELTSSDELLVVPVDIVEREDGEEVGEEQVNSEVGIGIADQV